MLGLNTRVSDSVVLGWSSKFAFPTSSLVTGAEDAGPRTTLRKTLVLRKDLWLSDHTWLNISESQFPHLWNGEIQTQQTQCSDLKKKRKKERKNKGKRKPKCFFWICFVVAIVCSFVAFSSKLCSGRWGEWPFKAQFQASSNWSGSHNSLISVLEGTLWFSSSILNLQPCDLGEVLYSLGNLFRLHLIGQKWIMLLPLEPSSLKVFALFFLKTSRTWRAEMAFYQFGSMGTVSPVAQSCPTLCNPMDCSMPGLPVHHQLLESTQTHAHWVSDAIQPSHQLSSPSPLSLNLSDTW